MGFLARTMPTLEITRFVTESLSNYHGSTHIDSDLRLSVLIRVHSPNPYRRPVNPNSS